MDKEFDDWAEEFDKNWKNSRAYQNHISKGYDEQAKNLFVLYIQYKSQEKLAKLTWWLVFATWALAFVTALLVIFAR